MPTSHDLQGLMKFLARDEWRECFDEVFVDHFGPVLDAGDMDFEDIAKILGDDWAMTLWGCAFEDFLTQDFEIEGGNIVKLSISQLPCSATRHHVRPQSRPLVARKSPNGSNISKINRPGNQTRQIQWQHTALSGCGTNSESSTCANNRYRISVSQ